METNEMYINAIEDKNLRETASILHAFILTYPGMTAKISYHIPFYYRRRWVCYLNLTRQATIELAFTYGHLLDNSSGILKANGRKQVMGISFRHEHEIQFEALDFLMLNALEIDDSKQIASTKAKKIH